MQTEPEFGDPINIGNPNEFTMIELAEKVISKIGGKSKTVFMSLPQDDPKQRQPDITKAAELLGWSPTISRAEGLQKTYAYFKSLPQSEWTKQPKSFS